MIILDSYKNVCCVYSIKNRITNTVYIGSTRNLQRRLYVHRSTLNKLTHTSKLMCQHRCLYGIDSFQVSIIKKYNTKFPDKTFEDKLIRESENTYNTKHLRGNISKQGFRNLISNQLIEAVDEKIKKELNKK